MVIKKKRRCVDIIASLIEHGEYRFADIGIELNCDIDQIKTLFENIFNEVGNDPVYLWRTEETVKEHQSLEGKTFKEREPNKFRYYILKNQQQFANLYAVLFGLTINDGKYDLNKLYVDLNAGKGEDKVYYDIKHPSERYIPISTMYWSIFEYKNHSTYYDSFMNLYNILHEYRFWIQFCEGERNEIFSLL